MTALPNWTTACPDWEERIQKGLSLTPNPPLFPHEAEEALEIFDSLRIVDAANSPTFGEITKPWARDFVAQIFGSYEHSTGIRHIAEYFMLISKKNSKSTLAAGVMLTALVLNWRKSAEFIILSPTVEVANNSFKPAADMIRADPELMELFQVQDHIRTITHRVTHATLKVVAAASETVSGKKAVGVLVDELWELGKSANAENMLREATGGLASRNEGFVIYLTTQSDEPPTGVFKKKLDYARAVRDGLIDDPHFLPVIYEFPLSLIQAKGHLDPKNFFMSNPNLGASVSVSFIEREFRKAQESDEETMRGFLAKHLNVEIGLNLRSDRWPGADIWEDGCLPIKVTLEQLIKECEVITFGIDGGGLDDLLGAAAVGRSKHTTVVTVPAHTDEETGQLIPTQVRKVQQWLSWEHAWAHKIVMERRKDIASRLRDFAQAGELTIADYIGQDVEQLANCVGKLDKSGLLFQVGLDPAAIGGILDGILAVGVDQEKIVTVNQGWRLAGAIKTTERKIAERVLVHGISALMNWCVGNAKVKVVGNAIVITKQVSGTAKIDPLMALFNAVQLMSLNPEAQVSGMDFNKMVIGG